MAVEKAGASIGTPEQSSSTISGVCHRQWAQSNMSTYSGIRTNGRFHCQIKNVHRKINFIIEVKTTGGN
ncbi:hypothetical protein T09_9119 [Trichinella sp. T9]|nr:hypothetical protein T09_9119 [Trichinella sp. T9]